MLVPCGHLEGDRDLGVERSRAVGGKVRAGTERDAVDAGVEVGSVWLTRQPEPSVGIRLALTGRRPPGVITPFADSTVQPDLHARGGPPGRRVENVRGQRHWLSIFVIRRRV